MWDHLITLSLGPLLLAQGWKVRRDTPVLPEPPGPRSGELGAGRRLSVLILGDSAAAGVGADHQDDALSGQIVQRLQCDYTVSWRLAAQTGATTLSTIDDLEAIAPQRYDVIVTSLGVNDVTSGVALSHWLERQRLLRERCFQRFDAGMIVNAGLPPVHGFPALPQPLRWYLGRRASQFDVACEQALEQEPAVRYLSLRFSEEMSLMASDGFHPGPEVYSRWAERVVDIIRACMPPTA